MAKMTAAQITAELQRKAAAGQTTASSAANQTQLNKILAANKTAASATKTTPTSTVGTTNAGSASGYGAVYGAAQSQQPAPVTNPSPSPFVAPSSGGGSSGGGSSGYGAVYGGTPQQAPAASTGGGAATPYVPGSQQQLSNVQTNAQGQTMYTEKAGANATQLLYLKKLYAGADASPQQKAWAAAQANKLYASDPSLANFQKMNAQQMNDYINGNQGGGEYTGGGAGADLYSQDDPSFGKAVDNSIDVMNGNGQTGLFDQYNQNVSDYGNAATNPTDPYWDNIRNMANSLGSTEYLQKKDSFQNLLTNLTAQQRNELDAIMGNLNNAENDVSNKSFQDWLQARQNLSSRGLSGIGSGFQQDADTRLQMNKQNALGSLYNTANQNIGKTNAQYGEKLSNAQQQLAGLNLNSLQQQQFQQLFDGSSKNLLEMAKVYAGLTGKQMPYAQFTGKDLLDSNFNYDKLNTEDKQFYAKLEQDYNLKMTDVMGTDAKGNPTLDMTKFLGEMQMKQAELGAKISHNRATEAIAINGQNLRSISDANKLGVTIANNNAKLQLAYDQLGAGNANSEKGRQLQALISQSGYLGQTYGDIGKMIATYNEKNIPVPAELTKMLTDVGGKLNAVYTGYEVIKGNLQGGATTPPPATTPPATTPPTGGGGGAAYSQY